MSEQKQKLDEKTEYRTLSLVGTHSLTVVVPKHFANLIGVSQGDYLKIRVSSDGKTLLMEKADQ